VKILVTSDVHGYINHFNKIISQTRDMVNYHVDLGDFNSSYDLYPNVTFIKGNCDENYSLSNELEIVIDSKKFLFLHGHTHSIKSGFFNLISYARKKKADFCIFGHLHQPLCFIKYNIHFICPGAVLNKEYLIINDLSIELRSLV